MRIVHINTHDCAGGAARAVRRLHRGLRSIGEDSSMFVFQACGRDPHVVEMTKSGRLADRIRRRLRRDAIRRGFMRYRSSRPAGCEPFQDCRSEFGNDFMRDLPDADVYHLHWVGNCLHHHAFLDYAVFFARVPQGTPVVWTLHDMNAFTGGCHYDLGCGGYTHGCGRCPQLGSDAEDDLSRRIWEEKRGVFSRVDPSRLRFVSPSRWLAEAFRISVPGRRFPVSVIPAGLDTGDFAPRDRAACRDILGLPRDGGVVLFLADEMDNLRKGFDLMVAAIRALPAGAPVTVLSVGRNRPDVQIRVPWVHAGPVDDERQLSAVYSAADLFVIPSRQDNLPNTVMESMACGTPVVGHNVGGIPEMVRHGETGLHVPPGDAAAMAGAIASLLGDPPRLAAMSANCRRLVMEEYPLALHARRYLGIYGMVTGTDVI